jgi:hypothetical protein
MWRERNGKIGVEEITDFKILSRTDPAHDKKNMKTDKLCKLQSVG